VSKKKKERGRDKQRQGMPATHAGQSGRGEVGTLGIRARVKKEDTPAHSPERSHRVVAFKCYGV
jgi:hypothetical protein